jgi:hypothetical protein
MLRLGLPVSMGHFFENSKTKVSNCCMYQQDPPLILSMHPKDITYLAPFRLIEDVTMPGYRVVLVKVIVMLV